MDEAQAEDTTKGFSLSVDKATFLIDMSTEKSLDCAEIMEKVDGMKSGWNKLYNKNFMDDENDVFVQFHAKDETPYNCRIDFNPNKSNLHQYRGLFRGKRMRITRLDWALDISADFEYSKFIVERTRTDFIVLKSGNVRTVNFGAKGSDISVKIYDKRQEIIDKGGKDCGCPLTRFEVVNRSGWYVWDYISPLKDNFKKVSYVVDPIINELISRTGWTMKQIKRILSRRCYRDLVKDNLGLSDYFNERKESVYREFMRDYMKFEGV